MRLLRAMSRGGLYSLRGIDPQLTVQELARRTGVSRITARRRMGLWRESGFWRGLVAYPNPALLGASLQMQGIVFDPGRDHSKQERAVGRVLEPAFMYHVQDFCSPVLLSETPARAARRQRALESCRGARVLCPPMEVEFAPSQVRLNPRDWRILRALRRSRAPDWVSAAKDVNVTVRGLERRIRRLMDSNALFFLPELDFRRSPGTVVWVGVLLRAGTTAQRVKSELVKRHPDLLFVENIFPITVFLPPEIRTQVGESFPLLLPIESASKADQLRREIAAIPGVVDALVGFPTQNSSRARVWDSRIEAAARRGSERPRPALPARSSRANHRPFP
jgi:DNA-binding Lrp family transcriptional regulator